MNQNRHHGADHSLRCHQCSMVFSSIKQLSMHRDRFCVGSNQSRYDPNIINEEQRLADEKIRQLRAMKEATFRRNQESQQRDRLLLSQCSMRQQPPSIGMQNELQQQLRQQVSKLSNKHDKNLTDLKVHGVNLRKSRGDIEDRLAELRHEGHKRQQYLEDEKLRLYEKADCDVIEELKNQIHALRSSESGWPSHQTPQVKTSHPAQPSHIPHSALEFNFSGGPLLAEISALRQYYLDTGGQDPIIVRQLSDMLKDAEALETSPRPSYNTRQHEQKPLSQRQSSEELIAMEVENYRLQRELLMLESDQRNFPGQSAGHLNNRLHQLQQDHNARIVSLEKEVELARHQALLDALRQDVRPPYQPEPSTYHYKPITNIPSSSYDPVQGFVCFYDFVMGLESSSRHCKLFVGMYNKLVELGEPSFLPTVYTEMTEGGTTAMIGARQPVPQCPPSKDLSLVVELQTSNSAPDDLRTKAWLKLDLFDTNNTLLAGAWRIPFRCPPIKPDHPTSAVASYPQYSNAALYMRVVNQRDSPTHSEAVISPANYVDYKIPPVSVTASANPAHQATPYSWVS